MRAAGMSMVEDWKRLLDEQVDSFSQYAIRATIVALQATITMGVILSLSAVVYALVYNNFVPKPLTREKVYFNFDMAKPTAYINLLQAERQWNYVNTQLPLETKTKPWIAKRFFKSGTPYNFDVTVQLAKSVRNLELGKAVLTLNVVDTSHSTVAQSYRPIIMPFQSNIYVHLESLVFFPCRLLGMVPPVESTTVQLQMMDNFVEPVSSRPPTEGIEFVLSTPLVDLLEMEVAIMPQVRGLVYCMYYHPYASFAVGMVVLSAIQFGILFFSIMAVLFGKLVLLADEEDRGRPSPLWRSGSATSGRTRPAALDSPIAPIDEGSLRLAEPSEVCLPVSNAPAYSTAVGMTPDRERAASILRSRRSGRVQSALDAISLRDIQRVDEAENKID